MADASRSPFSGPPAPPQTWGEAFAALPAETPDASRWPVLAQATARRAARTRRRRIGLALAAGLCALALLPFALRRADEHAVTPAPVASVVAPLSPPSPAPRHDAMPATPLATAREAMPVARPAPRLARIDRAKPHAPPRRSPATTHGTAPIVADTTTPTPAADTDTRAALDTLYASSAQLESLLALARDTRVDSGPAAALAGDYDAELAAIDAHLARPDLSAAEQLQLWQARVDTLEQAAGLESQLRALAASGGRLDGALVSID
jgi:hypothetical protein